MVIREFKNEDLDGIISCLKEVWAIDEITGELLNDFIRNDNYLYVIDLQGEIVGCANLHIQKKLIRNGGIAGFIEEVVVKEKYRGRKFGSFLIEKLITKAQQIGCYKISLSCFPERSNFYKNCGFFEENLTMRKNLL
jgi:glucosamine-phosphate N-acetyltransferase